MGAAGEGIEIASPLDERPEWCQRVVSRGSGRWDRARTGRSIAQPRVRKKTYQVGPGNGPQVPGNTREDAGNVRVSCPTAPVDASNVPAAISDSSGA